MEWIVEGIKEGLVERIIGILIERIMFKIRKCIESAVICCLLTPPLFVGFFSVSFDYEADDGLYHDISVSDDDDASMD